MDIIEQCKLWLDDGEPRKVIEALELVPLFKEHDEKPLLLAKAYTAYGLEIKDESYFDKACSLLDMCSRQMPKSRDFYIICADARCGAYDTFRALDDYYEALRLTSSSERNSKEYKHIIDGIYQCYEIAYKLLNLKSCKSLIQTTWKNISSIVDEAYEIYQEAYRYKLENGRYGDMSKMVKLFEQAVSLSNPFSFQFNDELGQITVKFNTNGTKEELYELVYLIKCCPKKLRDDTRWNFVLDTEPMPLNAVRSTSFSVYTKDTKVSVARSEHNQAHATLRVWSPTASLYLNDEELGYSAMSCMDTLIRRSLGQLTYLSLIDGIDFVMEEAELTSSEYIEDIAVVPLNELRQKLSDAGFKTEITAKEYLKDCYTTYNGDGSDNDYLPLRSDVFFGTTSTERLVDDYKSLKFSTIAQLVDDCVLPGFFAFKLNDRISEDAFPDEVMALRKRCEKFFSKAKGITLNFTGSAAGSKYCYIDFLSFEHGQNFIEQCATFFEQEQDVTEAIYSIFCPGVHPLVLKGDNDIAEQFILPLDKLVLGTKA